MSLHCSALSACVGAHVIVTATPIVENPNPSNLIGPQNIEPGCCAIALDYDSCFSSDAMKSCDCFIADDAVQLMEAKKRGPHFKQVPSFSIEHGQDLGNIIATNQTPRHTHEDKIFAMLLGNAVEDVVTAKLVYNEAVRVGSGTRLPV